jgi:drug/metabolite transporter (DMT)-like permease
VLSRLVLGALVLSSMALVRRVTLHLPARAWAHMAVAALLANVFPYLLLSYGEGDGRASAGVAGVLVGGTPLLTMLIATLALREERAGARQIFGFVAGFVGVVIVLAPWNDAHGSLAARTACLGAALSYAAGYVYVRKFLSGMGIAPLTLAATQLVAASVLQAVVTPFFPWQAPSIDLNIVLAVLALGVLSTGLANILYFRLIQDVGATNAAAVDYLVPVFAILFGVLTLGEPITWNLIAGGLVVLVGMGVAEGRLGHRPGGTGSPDVDATSIVPSAAPIENEPRLSVAAPGRKS